MQDFTQSAALNESTKWTNKYIDILVKCILTKEVSTLRFALKHMPKESISKLRNDNLMSL